MLLIVNFRLFKFFHSFSSCPFLLLKAAVLCPRGEAVLLHCVNERGCQCCYLGDLPGAVSALNSTGPNTVSTAPSAATRLIQSVLGESTLAATTYTPPFHPHTHTNTHTHMHMFTLSCQKAHREALGPTANQFSPSSFIDLTNVTSASPEQIWTSCVPIERRTEYTPALMIFVWYLNKKLIKQKASQTLECVQCKHLHTLDSGLNLYKNNKKAGEKK